MALIKYFIQMKSKLIFFILIITAINSWSQSTHDLPNVAPFSIELNYPVPIDENFVGSNFNGVLDAGVKYRFSQKNNLDFGVSVNGGILINDSNFNQPELARSIRITAILLQPRVFGELDFSAFPGFHISAGLGYSFILFNANGINEGVDIAGTSDTEGGFNINLAIAFDITKTIFVQVQYDFIKLQNDTQVPDINFNRNINLIKFGVGFRL